MKNSKRAIRRHHIQRRKAKVSKYYLAQFFEDSELFKSIYHSTVTRCSCYMCGNPRKYFSGHERFTMQERKNNAKWLVDKVDDV